MRTYYIWDHGYVNLRDTEGHKAVVFAFMEIITYLETIIQNIYINVKGNVLVPWGKPMPEKKIES